MAKHYQHYSLIDFLADETFKSWVLNAENEQLERKWQAVIQQHPHLIPLMESARSIILTLQENQPNVSEDQKVTDWSAIEEKLAPVSAKIPQRHHYAGIWWAVAAVFIAILSGVYFSYLHTPIVVQATAYGEVKEIILPDGSQTILYPNSSIKYAKTWKAGSPREVWVDGESHLTVVKTGQSTGGAAPNTRFMAHLNDSLSVTVLGTRFSVYNRQNQAPTIQLESGRVQVNLPRQEVSLFPGESVKFTAGKGLVKQQEPFPISRMQQSDELNLQDADVNDVARYVEGNFGVRVDVALPLQHRRLDGFIPFQSADECLAVLAEILNARLHEQHPGIFSISEK